MLHKLDASKNPTASSIAHAAAKTDHVLEQPPPPPPATPLTSVSALLFEEDQANVCRPSAVSDDSNADDTLRRSTRSDADLDDTLNDGLDDADDGPRDDADRGSFMTSLGFA